MSREQMIHDAAMEIMRDVGVRIHNPKAVEIFRENGIRVEDGSGIIHSLCKKSQIQHDSRRESYQSGSHIRMCIY